MDYAAIGKRVLKIRKHLGLSQDEFSGRIGISISFLGHIERGTRVMSIETLSRIAKAGGCSADYLLGLTEMQNCTEDVPPICLKEPIFLQNVSRMKINTPKAESGMLSAFGFSFLFWFRLR